MTKNVPLKHNSERRIARSSRPNCRVAAGSNHRPRSKNASDTGGFRRSQPGTILVPIDFTETSYKALDYALLMAMKLNCSVTLVHVLRVGYAVGFVDANRKERIRAQLALKARMKLNDLARTKGIADVPISWILRDGLPEYEILRLADDLRVELIILGRQDRNPLSRLIFGSVTADVIDAASCPVLVVNNSGFVPYEIRKDSFDGQRRPICNEGSHNGN